MLQKGNELELWRVQLGRGRVLILQLAHVINDLLDFRAVVVDLRSFYGFDDVEQGANTRVVLVLVLELLLQLLPLLTGCVSLDRGHDDGAYRERFIWAVDTWLCLAVGALQLE